MLLRFPLGTPCHHCLLSLTDLKTLRTIFSLLVTGKNGKNGKNNKIQINEREHLLFISLKHVVALEMYDWEKEEKKIKVLR